MRYASVMGNFTNESATAKMPVIPVIMPPQGDQLVFDAVGDVAFNFQFPMDKVSLHKYEADLQVAGEGGGKVVLKGYFANLPQDIDNRIQFYNDGYAFTSKGFFEAYPFQVTETDTDASGNSGGGRNGEYAGVPERAVSGITTLDMLPVMEGQSITVTEDEFRSRETGTFRPPPFMENIVDNAEQGGGRPTDPTDPEEPEGPKGDRFVMHTGSSAMNINNQSITGNVLANDGDTDAKLVAAMGGTYGSVSINAETGEVTYTLNANAASQMPSGSGQVTDTITYTAMDSNGDLYTQTVEVVIVRQVNGSGQYVSDNTIEDETHGFYVPVSGDKVSGTPEIVLSDGDDMVSVHKNLVDVEVEFGGGNDALVLNSQGNGTERTILDFGDGNNTVTMTSESSVLYNNSHLLFGDGDNDITLSGTWAMYSSSGITAGDGDNFITLDGGAIGFSEKDASFVHTGNGNNTVTVTGKSGRYGLSYGEVKTGSGNDAVEVSASNGKAAMSNYAKVDVGNGRNSVIVDGTHGMEIYSSIRTGDGDDVISVSGQDGYAMNSNSSINASGGQNSIYLSGKIGMEKSTIATGDGDDRISVNSWGGYAVGSSVINTGEGNNEVRLQGTREGLYYNSSIISGDGDDSITVSGDMWGIRENSRVDAGNGNNTISIGGAQEYGMYWNSSVIAGDGNDVINISGGKRGMSESASVNAGDGDNQVWVFGNDYAMYGSTITTGGGDDYIRIEGGNGAAMTSGSKVFSGAGNDSVAIYGSVRDGLVDLGLGNDVLRLESGSAGSVLLGNTKLDGGDNNAFDAAAGELGDIISLNHVLSANLSGSTALGGITSSNTVNFETLHLDLEDGNSGDLNIDQLLASLNTKGFKGDNAFNAVVLTGDQTDSVSYSGEWTASGQDVIFDGFDGLSFDRYTVMNGIDTLEIYIQSGMV